MVKIVGHQIKPGSMPNVINQYLNSHGAPLPEIKSPETEASDAALAGGIQVLSHKYYETVETDKTNQSKTAAFASLHEAMRQSLEATPGEAVNIFDSIVGVFQEEHISKLTPLSRKAVQNYWNRNVTAFRAQVLATDSKRMGVAYIATLEKEGRQYMQALSDVLMNPDTDAVSMTAAIGAYQTNMNELQSSFQSGVGTAYLTQDIAHTAFMNVHGAYNNEVVEMLSANGGPAWVDQAEVLIRGKLWMKNPSAAMTTIQAARVKNTTDKALSAHNLLNSMLTDLRTRDVSTPEKAAAALESFDELGNIIKANEKLLGKRELGFQLQSFANDFMYDQEYENEEQFTLVYELLKSSPVFATYNIDFDQAKKMGHESAVASRAKSQDVFEIALSEAIGKGIPLTEHFIEEQYYEAFERNPKLMMKRLDGGKYVTVDAKHAALEALEKAHATASYTPDSTYYAIDNFLKNNLQLTSQQIQSTRASLIPTDDDDDDDGAMQRVKATMGLVIPGTIPAVDPVTGDPILDASGNPIMVPDLANPATALVIDPDAWDSDMDKALSKILLDFPPGESRNQLRDAYREQGIWADAYEAAAATEVLSNFKSGQDPNGERMIEHFRTIAGISKKMLMHSLNLGYAGLGMEDGWQNALGMAIMSGNQNELVALQQLMIEGTEPGSNILAIFQSSKEFVRKLQTTLNPGNPEHTDLLEVQDGVNKTLNFATKGIHSTSRMSNTDLGAYINQIAISIARHHPDDVEFDAESTAKFMQTESYKDELRGIVSADNAVVAGHGALPTYALSRMTPLEREGLLRAAKEQDMAWNQEKEELGEYLFGFIPQIPNMAMNAGMLGSLGIDEEGNLIDEGGFEKVNHTGHWNLTRGLKDEGLYPVIQNGFLMEKPSSLFVSSGGVTATDAKGNPITIPMLDANGKPKVDADGDPVVETIYNKVFFTPVYEDAIDGSAPPIQGFLALVVDKKGNTSPLEIWQDDPFGNRVNVTPDGFISEKINGIRTASTEFLQMLEMDAHQQMFLDSANYAVTAREKQLTLQEGDAAFLLWDAQWEQSELSKKNNGNQP